MNRNEIKITFMPSNRNVFVLPGTTLLEAAARAGIVLQTPCGGRGTCGKCKVRILSGNCPPLAVETQRLGNSSIETGYRLACQAKAETELVVDIPPGSLFVSEHQILSTGTTVDVALQPTVRKVFFSLTPPQRDADESDVVRLRGQIGDVGISYQSMTRLPHFLRANNWKGTAAISNRHLIALEEGNTTKNLYGVAFDIGTTTIAGTLVDLATGVDVATASCLNPQIPYGDDVLSRIQRVREDQRQLTELQGAVVTALNKLIQQLIFNTPVSRTNIYEAVVAGNTAMQQIFCGFDPSALGEMPFVPVFDTFQRIHAAHLGLEIHPCADVGIYGQIGSFVGGDTLACMVASRIDAWKEPVLLIDIGTNGEIVLANGDTILATSTAAGPALEGARIRHGMRAATGAIEKVIIDGDVRYNVIGNAAPIGICGSGLIDVAAQMLRAGILDVMGSIVGPQDVGANTSETVRNRIIARDDGTFDFVLVPQGDSGLDEAIMITQKDIRELQLAIGAIRAGINILLGRAGLCADDLGAILLAGAFGSFIQRSSALAIGLLPSVAPEKIRSIGNAALIGARMALVSLQEREYAERLRRKTVHVDLSLDPEFTMEFGMAMMFPATEEGNT